MRWTKPCVPSAVLILSCALLGRAEAQILFDNGVPSKSGGFISDDHSGVRIADDFLLAAPATFNTVRFWGFYSPTDTPPASDAFTVVFYGNSGGLPNGANVLATHAVGNPGRSDTGDDTDGGGLDIYVYDATLGNMTLGPGQFWVSVTNNTPGDADDNWAWARHAFPGNDARSLDQGASWLHEFSDSELAFQLIVPEPATGVLALVVIGLVGVVTKYPPRRAGCGRRTNGDQDRTSEAQRPTSQFRSSSVHVPVSNWARLLGGPSSFPVMRAD